VFLEKMRMTDTGEDAVPEVERPRGRKLGVRQMENVYIPEFNATFNRLKTLLKKRHESKTIEIKELVKESLNVKEVIDAAVILGQQARDKFLAAKTLHDEAKLLRQHAQQLAKASKVLEFEVEKKSSRYNSYDDDDYEEVKSMRVKYTSHFQTIVNAAMLVQREHLDLEYLEDQDRHFRSRLRKSITMEQAVAVLEEAKKLADDMEAEHKRLLEQQESKNVRLEGVRTKREENIS
jgi:hypothetical protein